MEAEKPIEDTKLTEVALEKLAELAPEALLGVQPFFMGLGYRRPHLPFYFPEEFLNLYPLEDIHLPENQFIPENMPEIAWSNYGEIRKFTDTSNAVLGLPNLGDLNTTFPDYKTVALRRAYYAAISYVDQQIGIVLNTLQELGLAENTIVVLWGDHGWQLGEHNEWCKHNNFEVSNRVPLIVKIPGITDEGMRTSNLVEAVDIYPTLVEAAGLQPIIKCPAKSGLIEVCTEGDSLIPFFNQTQTSVQEDWKTSVFWQYPVGNDFWSEHIRKCMGISTLMDYMGSSWRYTMYVETVLEGEYGWTYDTITTCQNSVPELYHLTADPQENINRYGDAEYALVESVLQERLINQFM